MSGVTQYNLVQGWAIDFNKGQHEKLQLIWRAKPMRIVYIRFLKEMIYTIYILAATGYQKEIDYVNEIEITKYLYYILMFVEMYEIIHYQTLSFDASD